MSKIEFIFNSIPMAAGHQGPWTCDFCQFKEGIENITDVNIKCSFCDEYFSCCSKCQDQYQPADGRRICHLFHNDLPEDMQKYALIPSDTKFIMEELGKEPAFFVEAFKKTKAVSIVLIFTQKSPLLYVIPYSTYEKIKQFEVSMESQLNQIDF